MDKKTSNIVYGSILGIVFLLIFQGLTFLCNDGLGCLFVMLLPQFPLFMVEKLVGLNFTGLIALSILIITYALLGAGIGYLVYYFKNKK